MSEDAKVDITKSHWRCICGTVAMPLTDDTACKCGDIYEQEWSRVEPTGPHLADGQSLEEFCDTYQSENW